MPFNTPARKKRDTELPNSPITEAEIAALTEIVNVKGFPAMNAALEKAYGYGIATYKNYPVTGVNAFLDQNGSLKQGQKIVQIGSLKTLLPFGCSISQQCNAYMAATTSTTTADVKAGLYVLPVVNGAAFTAGQKISMPLYSARIWTTTVASVSGNNVTITDPTMGFIRTGSSVTINTTGTVPSLNQSYGATNAAIALLGGPVEVLPGYGYGGATYQAMIADLERDLRYYRPDYVALNMFENDLTGVPGAASVATYNQLLARARMCARLCLKHGATPIVYSSMPYGSASIGVPASRGADYDNMLAYLTAPVSGNKSQFELDVPGAYGDNLSTQWLDPAFIDSPTYSRRPLPGWTDNVHPNSNKRFAVGAFITPKLKTLLPPAASRLDMAIGKMEYAAVAGSGGTPVGNMTGIVPEYYVGGTFGAAVMVGSRNADSSYKISATWPGAATRNTDYAFTRYPIWMVGAWAGSKHRFKIYAKIRINSKVGIGQINVESQIAPTGEDHTSGFGVDCAVSLPADGSIICLETPHFALGALATSVTAWLSIKPTDAASPANASIDIDLIELGLIQCIPETPHEFV